MNRLEQVFTERTQLINIFITAGYPNVDSLPSLVDRLITSGVDVIEVGMPYSDPLADGPIIQKASAIALENGITISTIFDQIEQIRKKHIETPILIMGYFNQVLQVGVETFLIKCKSAGIDALIIPDLPLEVYVNEYKTLFEKYGIDISFLITPQTSAVRIKMLDEACSAFLYIVSDNSLTGAKTEGFTEQQISYFKRIKDLHLTSPTMIGFGISNRKMAIEANSYANGAIIGSAYLEAIRTNSSEELISEITY